LTKLNIKLEVLKLAHTHGREIAEVIGRAKAYEEYLLEGVQTESEKSGSQAQEGVTNSSESGSHADKRQKKSGNVDSLI
jgi:hypothetical protein